MIRANDMVRVTGMVRATGIAFDDDPPTAVDALCAAGHRWRLKG